MPVIAMTSSKGGCAKSTTTIILAEAIAELGHSVRIVDADRAARLVDWAAGDHPEAISVVAADEHNLDVAIKSGKAEADFVIIDVEGTANASIMTAVGYADLSIIPANHSAPDVAAALSTVKMIRRVADMSQRPVHHAILWSRVPNFQSSEMTALEQEVSDAGVGILGKIHERTAYRSLFSYRTVLANLIGVKEVPNVAKAQAEARNLASQVVERLTADRANRSVAA